MSGDPVRAEQAYKDGLARDPKNQPCRVNYGLMLARNHRVEEATQQLAAVLSPAEVSYNLAAIDEQQGAIAQARDGYKKALEQHPHMTAAQSKLAALDMREP
jgi:Tfp pilus assembly protein PilF